MIKFVALMNPKGFIHYVNPNHVIEVYQCETTEHTSTWTIQFIDNSFIEVKEYNIDKLVGINTTQMLND